MERPRAGLDLQSPPADADLPGEPGGQGLSLQRLFRPEPNPQDRRRELQAQSVRAGRPQDALDAARAYQLPQESQVTRHVCVEGWSMIGKWTGVPFRTFLQRIGADLTAKYVGFECADGYHSSIDMASALHPQTFLTFKISDEILAPHYGYPLKLLIPAKLGLKNPKWI